MNRITFPLKRQTNDPEVADLQDALQFLVNRLALLADDQAAARKLTALLIQERATQTFGRSTGELVSNFQREQRLQASGEVDEPTANALNALLKKLDPLEPAVRPHIVSGTVRREDGLPLQGIWVRTEHEAENDPKQWMLPKGHIEEIGHHGSILPHAVRDRGPYGVRYSGVCLEKQ